MHGPALQGNSPPDSWHVMERFVGQAGHFLPWGPPVYDDLPLPEDHWAAATADAPGSPTEGSSLEASSASDGW